MSFSFKMTFNLFAVKDLMTRDAELISLFLFPGAATIRAYGKEQEFIVESQRKVDFNQTSYYPSIIANRSVGSFFRSFS